MLFMGEEYAETSPFRYFVSHGDEELIRNVRDGRRKEFEHFKWPGTDPDSQSPEMFLRSELRWGQREDARYELLLSFDTKLLEHRRKVRAFSHLGKRSSQAAMFEPSALIVERWNDEDRIVIFSNFGPNPARLICSIDPGIWKKQLGSADSRWGGARNSTPSVLDATDPVTLDVAATSFSLFHLDEGVPH